MLEILQTVRTTSYRIAMIQIILCLLFYQAQTKTTYVILETEGITEASDTSEDPNHGGFDHETQSDGQFYL